MVSRRLGRQRVVTAGVEQVSRRPVLPRSGPQEFFCCKGLGTRNGMRAVAGAVPVNVELETAGWANFPTGEIRLNLGC